MEESSDLLNPESGLIMSLGNIELFPEGTSVGGQAASDSEDINASFSTPDDVVELFEVEFRSTTSEANSVFYTEFQDIPDTVRLLAPDTYQVFVRNRDFPKAAWDWPYYAGNSEPLTLGRGEFIGVTINAKPSNSRLKLEFSNDLSSLYQTYSATVTSDFGESLTYNQGEDRFGYFHSGHKLTVEIELEGLAPNGSILHKSFKGTIGELIASNSYILKVDSDLVSGNVSLEIKIDDDWHDVVIDFADNIDNQQSTLTTNRTVSLSNNNHIGDYPIGTSRVHPINIKTSSGEEATHNVYISNDKYTLGQLIAGFTGSNVDYNVPFEEMSGNATGFDEFVYINVESIFSDGHIVQSRSALYIQAQNPINAAYYVDIQLDQDSFDKVYQKSTHPQYFSKSDEMTVYVSRSNTEVSDARYHIFDDSGILIDYGPSELGTPVQHKFGGGGGIMRVNISAKPTPFSSEALTSINHYWIILGELESSDVQISQHADMVEIQTNDYAFNGLHLMAVWRTLTPEFSDDPKNLISDFTSSIDGKIVDRNAIEVGETVYYHVQVATGSEPQAAKSNVVSIAYRKD